MCQLTRSMMRLSTICLLRKSIALLLLWISMSSAVALPTSSVDSFTGTTTTATEWFNQDNGCKGFLGCLTNLDQYRYRFVGSLSKDRSTVTQCLQVQYEGSEWAFYAGAHDLSGTELKVAIIDRRIGRSFEYGGVTEAVCIQLSKPFLQTYANQPLVIRLEGKRGNVIVTVPTDVTTAYLGAIDSWPDTSKPSTRKVVLGIQYIPLERSALAKIGIDADGAHYVSTVAPGSLAEANGLRAGDLIVSVDSKPSTPTDILSELAQGWTKATPGKITVIRANLPINLEIVP